MVNTSSVFQLVFKLVQVLVQQRTLSKIRVLGSDPQLWPEEVRSKMEETGAKFIWTSGHICDRDVGQR